MSRRVNPKTCHPQGYQRVHELHQFLPDVLLPLKVSLIVQSIYHNYNSPKNRLPKTSNFFFPKNSKFYFDRTVDCGSARTWSRSLSPISSQFLSRTCSSWSLMEHFLLKSPGPYGTLGKNRCEAFPTLPPVPTPSLPLM